MSCVNLHTQEDQFSLSVCNDTEGSGRMKATVGQSQKIKVSVALHYYFWKLITCTNILNTDRKQFLLWDW
jgi:hypothetical protein